MLKWEIQGSRVSQSVPYGGLCLKAPTSALAARASNNVASGLAMWRSITSL